LFCTVVLIKDNIAHANMHTAAGAYVIRDLTTERDAFIVARLEEQDAIILGKANLSEWSNFMAKFPRNGFSVLGGQTKHSFGPYDVGGSSSGRAVAASLGLSTISVGTETSGSLIYPAAQNSTVALKPTLGLVSRDLIIPITEKQDTAGVMGENSCRSGKNISRAVHLMVQPSVARIFMADPLAVDTGFLPRFLICEPQSTIGSRLQAKIRHDDMELEAFSSRMRRILEMEMPMDAETLELQPRVGTDIGP
jgi:hypothetical protein